MEQFTNILSPVQLTNYENNVCQVVRNLAGSDVSVGAFEWLDADGFPFLFSDSDETHKTTELQNFYSEVELSIKVYMAIANLIVSNSMAWRYAEQTNSNQKLSDLFSEMYHAQRYYVMDSGKFDEEEVSQILKAID